MVTIIMDLDIEDTIHTGHIATDIRIDLIDIDITDINN